MRNSPKNLAVVLGFGLLASTMAHAAVITFPNGGGQYKYDSATGSASGVGDPNANVVGASFNSETNPAFDTYYHPNANDGTAGTVTYTFDAAAGQTFTAGNSTQAFNFFDVQGGETGSATESVTTNLNPTPVTVDSLTTNGSSYNTVPLPIVGASSFTITFTLAVSGAPSNIYVQLFREDNSAHGTGTGVGEAPFVVNTTAIPEPATLGLLAIGALGMLSRRRVVG